MCPSAGLHSNFLQVTGIIWPTLQGLSPIALLHVQVLRVSSLLTNHRQNVRLGKQLMLQPLSAITAACNTVSAAHITDPVIASGSSKGTHSNRLASRAAAAATSAGVSSTDASAAALNIAGPTHAGVVDAADWPDAQGLDADAADDSWAAAATAALAELLSTSPDRQPPGNTATKSAKTHSGSGNPGLLSVLQRLQHLEYWAFEQITQVVGAEASTVLSAHLQNVSMFEQRAMEIDMMLQHEWYTGCDELVEARRLARRNFLQRLCNDVSEHCSSLGA
jgi:hypothetical protein